MLFTIERLGIDQTGLVVCKTFAYMENNNWPNMFIGFYPETIQRLLGRGELSEHGDYQIAMGRFCDLVFATRVSERARDQKHSDIRICKLHLSNYRKRPKRALIYVDVNPRDLKLHITPYHEEIMVPFWRRKDQWFNEEHPAIWLQFPDSYLKKRTR
jgi:hypothetical protein